MINVNSKLSVGSFLNFGYDVTYTPDLQFKYPESLLIDEIHDYSVTKDIFMSCLERSIGKSNEQIVIPISGGLDSRALLAAVLEVCSADRIRTYTFGSKYSYDFEIGKGISKRLGIKCKGYELSDYDFNEESLHSTASMFDHQTTLFYHPPYQKIRETFESDLFLIGFMGDPIAGSHLPVSQSKTDSEIYEKFSVKNQMVKSCSVFDLSPAQLSDVLVFPDKISTLISKDEYFDFEVRQLKYVYPHVMPKELNCKSPFIDEAWVLHMLSLPTEQRLYQKYYNEFLINAFPLAFQYPCKNNLGLKLGASKSLVKLWRAMHRFDFLKKKSENYQDFNRRICDDEPLYQLLFKLLTDLETRQLDINLSPIRLLEDHKCGKLFYADAIINLASLEINLSGCE